MRRFLLSLLIFCQRAAMFGMEIPLHSHGQIQLDCLLTHIVNSPTMQVCDCNGRIVFEPSASLRLDLSVSDIQEVPDSFFSTLAREKIWPQGISLSNNGLRKLASSICLLQSIEELDLSCNSFVQELPWSICTLSNLKTLKLDLQVAQKMVTIALEHPENLTQFRENDPLSPNKRQKFMPCWPIVYMNFQVLLPFVSSRQLIIRMGAITTSQLRPFWHIPGLPIFITTKLEELLSLMDQTWFTQREQQVPDDFRGFIMQTSTQG